MRRSVTISEKPFTMALSTTVVSSASITLTTGSLAMASEITMSPQRLSALQPRRKIGSLAEIVEPVRPSALPSELSGYPYKGPPLHVVFPAKPQHKRHARGQSVYRGTAA